MYSVRPCTSKDIELNLQTTMYTVQPYTQQSKQSTNESVLKEIEQRQDILLDKIDSLYNQLSLYQNRESIEKLRIREALVVHLSTKQPSKDILQLIEQFREKLSIRTFCHSSLRNNAFKNPLQNSFSSNNQKLTVIWADQDNLPFMFHSHMQINDEQAIVNLLSQQFNTTNNNA